MRRRSGAAGEVQSPKSRLQSPASRVSGFGFRVSKLIFMDRKSIAVIVACVVMLTVWQFVIVPKYWPYKPPPPSAHVITNGVVQGTLTNGSDVSQQLEQAVQTAASMTRPGPQLEVNTNTP